MRTEFAGARRKELMLDLRYLDPRPSVSRIIAVRLLYPAVGAAALAAVLVGLASVGVLSPMACLVPAFVLGLAGGIITWRFLQRPGERAVFRTARGHADVLDLFAGIGHIATLRRIVPAVVGEIRAASEPRVDTQTYLREEMREHYRLAKTGVISADECSTCTRRILAAIRLSEDHGAICQVAHTARLTAVLENFIREFQDAPTVQVSKRNIRMLTRAKAVIRALLYEGSPSVAHYRSIELFWRSRRHSTPESRALCGLSHPEPDRRRAARELAARRRNPAAAVDREDDPDTRYDIAPAAVDARAARRTMKRFAALSLRQTRTRRGSQCQEPRRACGLDPGARTPT